MNLLDLSHVSKSYGLKQVLRDVTLTVGESEKVGFVGRNGCGKTTLFRIIAGVEPADGGEIAYKRGISIGVLTQDPVLTEEWTVAEEVDSALVEVRQKRHRYQAIGEALRAASPEQMEKLLKEQQALGEWFDHHQGWQVDHRIDEVLLPLGISDRNQKILMLSGGMRKRVALAKLVLQSPDLLLLDEPTNHLDAATTAWLEEFLIAYPGAVMLVTHDRYFLDRVAQRIFEIESGGVYSYLGGYLDYLEGKAERLLHESREQGRLVTLLRRESEWMRRGPKARTTKSKARIDKALQLRSDLLATSMLGKYGFACCKIAITDQKSTRPWGAYQKLADEFGVSTTGPHAFEAGHQGRALVELYELLRRVHKVDLAIVHRFVEDPGLGGREGGFGVLGKNLSPKPAFCDLARLRVGSSPLDC